MDGELLLTLARASVLEEFGRPKVDKPDVTWLAELGACFVTLRRGGDLRGCIGTVRARRSLFEDVVQNAKASAFEDPRFDPLAEHELATVSFEVSVLSAPEPLEVRSEQELLRALRPGVDGIELSWGGRAGLFIPAVWEQLPEPRAFLTYLKRKAGLPSDWMPGTRVLRFSATKFDEDEGNEVSDGSRQVVAQAR